MSFLRSRTFRRFHTIFTAISLLLLIVNLIEHNWLQVAAFGLFAAAWVQITWLQRFIERHPRKRD